MPTLVWRGVDAPRMEIAHVDSLDLARGTQIGLAYELRWQLSGSSLRVEIVDGPARDIDLGGADFFDLGYSPFFNSLPVARDRLLEDGPERAYRMRFVDVPELTDDVSAQRYEPLAPGLVRFRSGSFTADLELDADGFVVRYPGLAERVDLPHEGRL